MNSFLRCPTIAKLVERELEERVRNKDEVRECAGPIGRHRLGRDRLRVTALRAGPIGRHRLGRDRLRVTKQTSEARVQRTIAGGRALYQPRPSSLLRLKGCERGARQPN